MHLLKKAVCAAACATVALVASAMPAAFASTGTDPLSVVVTAPSLNINLNHLDFGSSYVAVNKPTSTASATVSPAIVLTNVEGTPGSARLIPIDTSTVNKLLIDITGGVPNSLVSLSLMDDTALTPYLTLVGQTTPSDATFKIDSWTYAIQPGGGALTFNASTATGTITLSNTGGITLWFGATLHTVASNLSYSNQTYSGTLRITVDY